MLPSTGYFKSINCPFYDNSECDRPYCHFKHVRREDASTAPTVSTQSIEGHKNPETSSSSTTTFTMTTTTSSISKTDIIQQLVTEAVTKVLVDQGVADTDKVSENIVSKVVEGLKPKLTPTPPTTTTTTTVSKNKNTSIIGKHSCVPQLITKPPCIYNPTPISELKKRHNLSLPFYNPIRDNKLTLKRKTIDDNDDNDDDITEPWSSGSSKIIKQSDNNELLTYKPTIINNDNNIGYIPTIKTDSNNLLNSYDDSNSSDYIKYKEPYYPKVKKRREEYVPKKIKTPLQTNQQFDDITIDDYNNQKKLNDDTSNNSITINNTLELNNKKISNDDDDDKESGLTTKEVQNINKTIDDNTIVNKEKENNKNKIKTKDNKIVDDKSSSTKNSTNSDHHNKSSDKKKLDKENSKNHSDKKIKHHSSSSNKDHDDINELNDKKDSKEHKHSSDRHKSSSSTSSTSRHKSKSSHRDSSSHRSSRDKSHSSSSRDKKSSSKENEQHRSSSKNDKYKSSSSSRSDKKSSSKSSSDKKKTNSSRSNKSSDNNKSEKKKYNNESDNDSDEFGHFDQILEESSDSEHDVEEECLKIFQEYQEPDNPKDNTHDKSTIDTQEFEEIGKKRVAHPSASTNVLRIPGSSQSARKIQNPQQKMYERWRLMKKAAAEKSASASTQNDCDISIKNQLVVKEKIVNKFLHTEPQANGNARMRIAHVPYAMSLALTKKKVIESATKPVELKTVAQTTKGTPRVAHVPQTVPQLIRPEPLQLSTQKFHLNVRQYYINMMQDICVQIYTNGDDAAQRALREELGCHERCTALSVYKNSCMLAVHKLRKEVNPSSGNGSTTLSSSSGMVSHDAVLAGKTKGSWSVVKSKKIITDFKGSALYFMLKKWIMSEQQLKDFGYPRLHPDGPKGRAKVYVINSRNKTILSKVPNERYCGRCNQPYMIDKHGLAVRKQNCIYHWGRKFTFRGESKYSCCQQEGSASGCCDAKNHVWDVVDYDNLYGYVQTLPKDKDPEDQGVYALDCEMCYTSQGLELTRITVINEDCKVIYESLVKPDNPIIDYNTRFSGITEENMKGITTTLRDVQAVLLAMFSEHSILIGHSLESDFKALKFIHNTVVDTSFMFPHKNGFPQKRALRNLCSEYLRKIIQNDVSGHDSKEDAVACMELVHWKVKEEAKLQ